VDYGTGIYLGYFTEERNSEGKTYFLFLTKNHTDLVKRAVCVVVKDRPVIMFKRFVTVPVSRQDEIRKLIKRKKLIAIEFERARLVEIYNLTPKKINTEKQ